MLSTQLLRREKIGLRWWIDKPVVYTSLFWAVCFPVPFCLHNISWSIVQYLIHWKWLFLANTKYPCLEKVECLFTNKKKADRRHLFRSPQQSSGGWPWVSDASSCDPTAHHSPYQRCQLFWSCLWLAKSWSLKSSSSSWDGVHLLLKEIGDNPHTGVGEGVP